MNTVDTSAGISGKSSAFISNQVHLTKFRNPADGKLYDIPVTNSPNSICDRILRMLDVSQFLPILTVGASGSGKSTWIKYLVHQLHTARSFHISWFERDDIKRIDKIIPTLTKGIDHIVVFDDASFALDEMNKEEVSAIAKRLTYIRHETKGKVVLVMNVHYSKAIGKFFRSVPFTFHTSISMEEIKVYKDLYGRYSGSRLQRFAGYYQKMMLAHGWSFTLSSWANKALQFKTNAPFRIGLVNEINKLHFFLYVKHSCKICDKDMKVTKFVSTKDFIDHYVDAYGLDKTRSIMRMYSFVKYGLKVLDRNRHAIWGSINNVDQSANIDWDEVNAYLDSQSKYKRRRPYVKKGTANKIATGIVSRGASTEDANPSDSDLSDDAITDLRENFRNLDSEEDADGANTGSGNPASPPPPPAVDESALIDAGESFDDE